MRISQLFLLASFLSLNVVVAQENSKNHSKQSVEQAYLELPRIQVIPIKDTNTGRQYELYIKLPDGYSENNNTQYPVLYFTDAIWHIEILSSSTEFLMENAILVGISWQKDIKEDLKQEAGAHVSRYRDYSVIPSNNALHQAKYQFGQASDHLAFIRDDVMKYVESSYRADPDSRSYFGYSLGGLLGAYILLAQPETFNNYILGSPSLRGNNNSYLNGLKSKDLHANVFISYGNQEEELGSHVEEFITMLKNKSDETLSIQHIVIEGSHQTAFPMTAVRSVTWLSNLTKE